MPDLSKASKKGDLARVHELIREGVDVNNVDSKGRTPLFCASGLGHLQVVEALLGAEADVNKASTDGGHTPLQAASRDGHLGWCRLCWQPGRR